MKIVILAAGKGARFGELVLPKPLTKLANGKSILELQLDRISKITSLTNVTVVVGYHKDAIIRLYPQLCFVENPSYETENTSKSLLRAIEDFDDDVLWMNGDVVFNERVLPLLLANKTSMVVNRSTVGEEEVKYRTDENGRILSVSKEVEHGEGEAVGINFFTRQDLPMLRKYLENCRDNDYFEKAVEGCIKGGLSVWSTRVEVSDCVELDFPEDLIKANRLLSLWSEL